ncbi:MAG: S-methyl-5'-thioadenosine phosphorylase [Elusimicrobiota bacterium]
MARSVKRAEVRIGIIGGSGLYAMQGAKLLREARIKTPFGAPSDAVTIAEVAGVSVAFLPRHGKGHRISPTEINFRANIYALKSIGVERIIGVAATGSLKEELAPRDLVIPDQLVDKTRHRASTFFTDGIVAHVQFNKPFCPGLGAVLAESAQEVSLNMHSGGVYVCMEGPAFSTLAESQENRRMGYDLIGMTASPEAKLAREAEICYATLAFVTDYDCWKEGEEAVNVEALIGNLTEGTRRAQMVLAKAIPKFARHNPSQDRCACRVALSTALVTDKKMMDKRTVQKLKLLVGKYV